ncbi:MAG: beta-lactamase family protein [Bacteroidia bacterium]
MNSKSKFLFLIPIVYMFCSCKDTLVLEDSRWNKIDSILVSENDADNFHGAVVLGTTDKVLFTKYLGISNRIAGDTIDANTIFDMASINKSFAGYMIAIAEKEERISTDDKLVDLLSEYDYSGQFDSSITIKQMLTHTSGLCDYDGVADSLKTNGFRAFKKMHFSNAQYVDFISQLKPVAEPGEQLHYSNFAYHLLNIIIEDIYGQPLNEVLQEKVCEPHGLNSTLNSIDNKEVIENLAIGYNFNYESSEWVPNEYIDLTLGRRIFTTILDLHKWGQIQSDLGKEFPSLHTNHLENLTNQISYGYGWVIYNEGDSYRIGGLDIDKPYIIHGGSTEGYKSILVNINNGELVVAIMANSGSRTNENDLLKKIVKSYYLN